ncbi:hypothetical protein RCO28_27645 [Streptomyces sp. LHD-70]|uniref:hypothetical protein n=1 Tax=Streptomyces sp. LHD-70 TaxID=3072140 RepID=UPI00280FB174|nr:hypothetical protein [Streptomyces sp. LHD-70]MDQ8706215.1 hypothetical protein [Streptomyces sp. LHD-70]
MSPPNAERNARARALAVFWPRRVKRFPGPNAAVHAAAGNVTACSQVISGQGRMLDPTTPVSCPGCLIVLGQGPGEP